MRELSILALILCAIPALAKNPLPSQSTNQSTDLAVNLSDPPVPVGGLTVQQSGAAATTNLTYSYRAVIRTLIGNMLFLSPPFIISAAQIERIVTALRAAIIETRETPAGR